MEGTTRKNNSSSGVSPFNPQPSCAKVRRDGVQTMSAEPAGQPYKKTRTLARVCCLVLGACAVVALAGWLYFRQPHFSGKEAAAITVFAAATNGVVLIDSTVTNRDSCAAIFGALRKARWGIDHKCAPVGTITLQYSNGKKDELGFLPSHGEDEFEFRHGWLKYNLAREKMYEVLKAAGVDTEKMPESQ